MAPRRLEGQATMGRQAKSAGFDREFFGFLRELEANNNRPWFEANRGRYERAVRVPVLGFIRAMAPRLERISPYIVAQASQGPGGSMMRIHRDTRFSGDKSPYKTYVGVCFAHERGSDVHCPAFWLNAERDGVFLAAGIWHPDAATLAAIRRHIAARPAQWQAVRRDAKMRRAFGDIWGESLRRPPRGFDPAHPCIDDIKRKEFLVVHEDKPAFLLQADLPEVVARKFAAARPLMRFLCAALGLEY